MKMRFIFSVLIPVSILVSCSTLVKNEQIEEIKKLEQGVYTLKTDIYDNTGSALPKGAKIKLVSKSTNDFIKIYAYNVKEPRLDAKWYLLLYLFQEDFPIENGEQKKKVQYGARSTTDKDDKTKYVSENYQGDDAESAAKEVYDYNNYLFSMDKLEKKLSVVAVKDESYKE